MNSKQATNASRLVTYILQTYVIFRAKCINKQALIQTEEDSAVKVFFCSMCIVLIKVNTRRFEG